MYKIDRRAFIVLYVMHILCFFLRINQLRVNVNVFEKFSNSSSVIVVSDWVLAFEASYISIPFISLADKYHYIPIYLLCGFSNILSIIIWLNSWSCDGRENIYANNRFQLMILHGITVTLIATTTYLYGLFIYLKNAAEDIYDHIIVVVSFVAAASNNLFFVSAIYFLVFSSNVLIHFFSGVLLMGMHKNCYLACYDITPQIANKTLQRLLVFFRGDFRHLCVVALCVCGVNDIIRILYVFCMYDLEMARKIFLANESILRVAYSFLINFILPYHTTAGDSIYLLIRTLHEEERLEDLDSDSETGSDTSSEISWRRRG